MIFSAYKRTHKRLCRRDVDEVRGQINHIHYNALPEIKIYITILQQSNLKK